MSAGLFNSKKPGIKRAIKTAILYCTLTSLILCVTSPNPYKDTSLCNISIVDVPFHNNSIIPIFSTFSFAVELTLQAQIDSFRVHVDDNRLWGSDSFLKEDTVITKKQFKSDYRFSFQASIYDTGKKVISATAYLQDGNSITDSFRFYTVSPLHQKDIVVEPGNSVLLSTAPVSDKEDVIYVWRLGNSRVMAREASAEFIVSPNFGSTKGELYIQTSNCRSPSTYFSISINDITAPHITCLNDSIIGRNIYTGRIPFYFRIQVTDKSSRVYYVSINGTVPDECDTVNEKTLICTKKIPKLNTGYGESTLISVNAADDRGNIKKDTFFVYYDPTLKKLDGPIIKILIPEKDSIVYTNRNIRVRGTIEQKMFDDTLILSLDVNSQTYPTVNKIISQNSEWAWDVFLNQDINQLIFNLYKKQGIIDDTMSVLPLTIFFDSSISIKDIEGPQIVVVKTGSVQISDKYTTNNSPLVLDIIAYDRLSSILDVSINGIAADSIGNFLYRGLVYLQHKPEGNLVEIKATDTKGNTSIINIVIVLNSAPYISYMNARKFATAGQQYIDTIVVADGDGDLVDISVSVETPSGGVQKIEVKNGVYSWTPQETDTGQLGKIRITLYDGYTVTDSSFVILIKATSDPIPPQVSFITSPKDIPDTIIAATDSLNIVLRTEPTFSSGKYLVTARLLPNGKTLLQNSTDSVIKWIAQLSDTGIYQLEITVTASPISADTIKKTITILAPLQVYFAQHYSSSKESASSASILVALSRPAAKEITVWYQIDTMRTTATAEDFTLINGSKLVFSPYQLVKPIMLNLIDDLKPENNETVAINLISASPKVIISSPASHTFIILNDDIPTDTLTAYFDAKDTSGDERAFSLKIPIRLSTKAFETISFKINRSGTATYNSDYLLSDTIVTFNKDETHKEIVLTIIDDLLCERYTESIILTLWCSTPGVNTANAIHRYLIYQSDLEECLPRIIFVHGGNEPAAIDKIIIDSIVNFGYEVTAQPATSLAPSSFAGADGVFISASSQEVSAGQQLKNTPIPVVCASIPNSIALGLAMAPDTFEVNDRIIIRRTAIVPPLNFLNQTIQILNDSRLIPYARPSNLVRVEAYIPGSGGSRDTIRSAISIYEPPSTSSLSAVRRCTFPMVQPQYGGVVYRRDWWRLLRIYLDWVIDN